MSRSSNRVNFGTGGFVNPFEGLQSAIGDISKSYLQQEALEREEKRLSRAEAKDQARFDLQQSRLDTQEAWQRQKYDEDKARQERLDTINAEDRTWNRNRQITADERADLVFKQGQQELKEKQAIKAADKALQEGFFGLVDKAVLGTSAGVEAQTELARRAAQETQNLRRKDEAVFGNLLVPERDATGEVKKDPTTGSLVMKKDELGTYRAPNIGNITQYGKDVAIGAAKPTVDRAELVQAMNPYISGTSTSPTELMTGLDKLQLGTDTEAVRAAQAKSASDLAKRIAFGSDGNNITVNSSTGEVTRTGTSTPNKLTSGFVPDKLASSDDWGYVPFAESTATNIAKTQIEAGVKNMTAAEQSRMTQLMVEQGYLKPKEGSLVEDKSLGPKEFNVLLQKAKQELGDKPELQDPVTRYKEIYNRLLKDSQKDVVSDRVSAVLGRGVNSYADYNTTPTKAGLNVSGSTGSETAAQNSIDPVTELAQKRLAQEQQAREAEQRFQEMRQARQDIASVGGSEAVIKQVPEIAVVVGALQDKGVAPDRAKALAVLAYRTGNSNLIEDILDAPEPTLFGGNRGTRLTPQEAANRNNILKAFWETVKPESKADFLSKLEPAPKNNKPLFEYSKDLLSPEDLLKMKAAQEQEEAVQQRMKELQGR